MSRIIKIKSFLEYSKNLSVIDVRSPGEFIHGHIPGSVNIPLFNNEERTSIGILYKKHGQKEAILKGLEIGGKKARAIAEASFKWARKNEILIHCWRGGMRSESVSWLLEQTGIKCYILQGGYKSYRRFLRGYMAKKFKLCILGGMTGSGKTEILNIIEGMGYQVIHLERIANNKGSVFGSLGENPQKSNEQFENDLFAAFYLLNLDKTIWIEDESRNIGHNVLPPELFKTMSTNPVIVIEIGRDQRVKCLVRKYGNFPQEDLLNCLNKISRRLGGLNTQNACLALNEGNPEITANIVLEYYDKSYQFSLDRKLENKISYIALSSVNPEVNALRVLAFALNNKLCTPN